MIVDEHGKPKDTCVLRKAGVGLDAKAFEAAQKYRFDPATLNGTPVAVCITIQVNFRLY